MSSPQDESAALFQSIEVAKALKQQNVELKSAFDHLQKEYIALEQDLSTTKTALHQQISAKKSMESDCQKLYKKWNEELKIQAQEFEKIQSEMISNSELELLKVKIIEELEISYDEKLNWMKREMEKYQNLYTTTLRELEILKMNHTNTQNSFDNLLNEQKTKFNFRILELQQRNEDLKQQNMKNNNNILLKQELQEYKTKNIEFNQTIKCLRKQINGLNERNSELCIQTQTIKCENITKIKEIEGKLLMKETECNALKRVYNDLQKEYDTNKQNYLFKENELQKLESNQNYLKKMIENKKEQISKLNDSFSNKEKSMKQQNSVQINALNDKISNFETHINTINTKRENLRIEINKLSNAHLSEIQQIKQENFSQFNDLIESKQEMSKKYEEIKNKWINLQNESDQKIDSFQKELDTQTIRTQQIEKEKNNISEINRKYKQEINDLLNDIKCLKNENSEINNEYQSLTNKHRDILDINYKLTNKENKYLTQIEFLENDISEINKKIENKIKDLSAKYENEIKETNANNKTNMKCVNKLKKEKAKYKKLATLTKLKVNGLSKELINIKRNFQTELKSKSFEITNLSKQMYQIERERDEIKFRLTMDSATMHNLNNNQSRHFSNNNSDLITSNVEILLKELEKEQISINNKSISMIPRQTETIKEEMKEIDNDQQSNAEDIEC